MEVRTAGRVQRPDHRFDDVQPEGEGGEGSDRRQPPAGADAHGQRRREEEEQAHQRDEQVGPERAEALSDSCPEVKGARWKDREEVLVPGEEHRTREQIGRFPERQPAREPCRTDHERHQGPDDPGAARDRSHREREQRDAEERAFGAREEEDADEPAGDRPRTHVAARRPGERDEEAGPDECGDRERVERHPRGRERTAADPRERRGSEAGPRRGPDRSRRDVRRRRNERRGRDHGGLRRSECTQQGLERHDPGRLQHRRERHPEAVARHGERREAWRLEEVPHEVGGQTLTVRDAPSDVHVVVGVGEPRLDDDEHSRDGPPPMRSERCDRT